VATVVVVGLGPAGPDLLTEAARRAIERIPQRYLRTTRHPAAVAVPGAHSFDEVYDRVRERCATLGYALVDGSSYLQPGAQP